jgi:hypothetical protein
LRLVAVEVAADLRRSRAERTHELHQLHHLAGVGVEGEPVRGERRPEGRVGHHGGVPDAVDGIQQVAYADGVRAAPAAFGQHPGVDLQVQMAVRIPSTEV